MKVISTLKAPAAAGPYSQAVLENGILYISGQIPIDPATNTVLKGGIREQAEQIMKNIGEILKEAGTDYSHVVKTTCFLKDMKDFAEFNAIYANYFTSEPARSCAAVSSLPKDTLAEVDVIAVLD